MPTKNPRINVTFDPALLHEVELFRMRRGISMSAAVIELATVGLDFVNSTHSEMHPIFSGDELLLLCAYRESAPSVRAAVFTVLKESSLKNNLEPQPNYATSDFITLLSLYEAASKETQHEVMCILRRSVAYQFKDEIGESAPADVIIQALVNESASHPEQKASDPSG